MIDFLYTFDQIDDICHSLSVGMHDLDKVIERLSSTVPNAIRRRDIDLIIKIIAYSESAGIPIRPVGIEIRTYNELLRSWMNYRADAPI